MIYNGVPGGEDQNLAYRLTQSAGDDGRLLSTNRHSSGIRSSVNPPIRLP